MRSQVEHFEQKCRELLNSNHAIQHELATANTKAQNEKGELQRQLAEANAARYAAAEDLQLLRSKHGDADAQVLGQSSPPPIRLFHAPPPALRCR